MSASHVEFTPSISAALVAPHTTTRVALPTPDPTNPTVVMRNNGPALVAIRAGGVAPPQPHAPGSVTLHGGQTLLLTDPVWSTAAAANLVAMPGIVVTGEGAHVSGQQTTVTFTRGRTVERWLFTAPGVEVI